MLTLYSSYTVIILWERSEVTYIIQNYQLLSIINFNKHTKTMFNWWKNKLQIKWEQGCTGRRIGHNSIIGCHFHSGHLQFRNNELFDKFPVKLIFLLAIFYGLSQLTHDLHLFRMEKIMTENKRMIAECKFRMKKDNIFVRAGHHHIFSKQTFIQQNCLVLKKNNAVHKRKL